MQADADEKARLLPREMPRGASDGDSGFPTKSILRPCSKKGRGRAQKSLDLIEAMYAAAEAAQPITGRGIGYKLFTAGLIPSMARSEMQRVYRLLKEAREEGNIPWEWIVDETRSLERVSTWADPADYARCVARSYRRDFWNQQPVRVEVWSEKGTIRGVLAPVLDQYAVGFRVMHGFSSATSVHDVADDDDGRDLIALYVGDYDPSGMFMSEQDLPSRLAEYDGDHVDAAAHRADPRAGQRPAVVPGSRQEQRPSLQLVRRDTTASVVGNSTRWTRTISATAFEKAIIELIEPVAWKRCEVVNRAEQESLRTILQKWKGARWAGRCVPTAARRSILQPGTATAMIWLSPAAARARIPGALRGAADALPVR